MKKNIQLPTGQKYLQSFPRFGLSMFIDWIPDAPSEKFLNLGGDVAAPCCLDISELSNLEHVNQVSDFHCVTTWSYPSVQWGGYRFRDFYEQIFKPRTHSQTNAQFVVFRCQDEYSVCLLLEDLLAHDVLLVDTLNQEPLPFDHGAPLRIVAPTHYGYKSAKYVTGIKIWRDLRNYKFPGLTGIKDHLRARVAEEERGKVFPGWLYRYVYRFMVRDIINKHS